MSDIFTEITEATGVDNSVLGKVYAGRRLVPILGEITPEMADGAARALMALDVVKIAPITLLIGSDGGCLKSSNDIGGIIQTLRSPVDGLVIGRAGSSAFDLLLKCRVRMALPNAMLFTHFCRHNIEAIIEGDISKKDLAELKRRLLHDRHDFEELYMKRLGMTRKQVYEICRLGEKFSMTYDARGALKHRMIDKIVKNFKLFGDCETD